MGDRAYAQVLCHGKDVAAFEDVGFTEQEYWKRLPEGVSFLVDQEANYGNSSSLRELAERGYVFVAQHDAGGDYDAGRLVSDGKTFREVDAMGTNRDLAWRWTPMGSSTRSNCRRCGSIGAPSRERSRSWASHRKRCR